MSDWGEQENEDIISGAMKSRSGWAILGNLVVHAWHCTGFFEIREREKSMNIYYKFQAQIIHSRCIWILNLKTFYSLEFITSFLQSQSSSSTTNIHRLNLNIQQHLSLFLWVRFDFKSGRLSSRVSCRKDHYIIEV